MQSVYLTWMISALALGVILLPVFKPPWAKLSLPPFVDFFRRYWVHILIVFAIYNAKDVLDQVDRLLMASTGLDMTPYIWAIEGNLVLWVQETFEADWLTIALTHFYVAGFMFICYVSVFYFAYFDDRWLADRVTLSIAWVYILAVPFYLFFNVRVTGDTIPGMETLAYTLTPEIADWFRRIDPFTNGMPSLHIGIPFAVWLCLTRFDDDRRWNRYRYTVFAYTLLTAFTIIYLGIHWFLDIIGGMLIAGAAVSMADRTSNGWWKFFDERTMNARIVTVLTRPGQAWAWLTGRVGREFKQYRTPTSRETGRMAVAILIVVAAVITWDLTHRSLPAGGVEAPEAAAVSDEWLATLDNQTEGVSLLLQNLSAADAASYKVDVPGLSLDSTHALQNDLLVVANGTALLMYDVHQPERILSTLDLPQPEHLLLCERASSMVLVYTLDGVLEVTDLEGTPVLVSDDAHEGIEQLTCSGSEIAYVTAERPMEVTVLQLGVRGEVGYTINASAPVEEDEILASWGTPVDMENATVQSMAFDREYLAVTVNVSATDRLVLYNRTTAEQWLASNPKYHVSDISLDHGILAWSVRDHLNPLSPQEKYLDREIYFIELATNTSFVLTSDYKDQWGPLVLEHQLVYFEMDDDTMSMRVHAWEPELRLYSSLVLQTGVLTAFVVVAWNMWQRQSERRQSRQP
ncbi:MAG: phosphatase PAP2 family protein [Candidatus Poseidoniales archaeon]